MYKYVLKYVQVLNLGNSFMRTTSYTDARSNLAEKMDEVCDDHIPLIITRQKARSVVMLSLEDYEGLQETAYLYRSPKNAERLMTSVKEMELGNVIEKDLIE